MGDVGRGYGRIVVAGFVRTGGRRRAGRRLARTGGLGAAAAGWRGGLGRGGQLGGHRWGGTFCENKQQVLLVRMAPLEKDDTVSE